MAIVTCAHLNHRISAGDSLYSNGWRRALSFLGEYTTAIIRALNMRPERVALLGKNEVHVLVRISLANQDVVLRIAPEVPLTRDIYFGRAMELQRLPAARILSHDTSGNLIPFPYLIEQYVSGIAATYLETPTSLRSAARQVGSVLRRMHRVQTPGWGEPDKSGRWTTPSWAHVLARLHARLAPETIATALFDAPERKAIDGLRSMLGDSVAIPRLIHGSISPHTVRCTMAEKPNLEALVNPGPIVGGDAMFDLARGLGASFPPEWRLGLIEGYTARTPLSAREYERLQALRILIGYWETCQRSIQGLPYQEVRAHTLALLVECRELLRGHEVVRERE